MSRPYHVYDYEGEHLGSFATWELAHEWAHLQAMLNGVPTPLEVEDRATTGRRRVWADRCEPVPRAATHAAGAPAAHAEPTSDGSASDGPAPDEFLDDLGAGLCSAASAAVFAPPLPRQPSELAELTEAGRTEV